MPKSDWLKVFTSKRLFVVMLLGFSSGLPLALTGSTLEARYATSGADLSTIGFVTMLGLPYVLKPLWAPFLDRFVPPFLGRRRGWMLLTQISLFVGLSVMAVVDVEFAPVLLAMIALVVVFLSASQDIAIDAYRTDVLTPAERGLGVTLFINAYRIAMLVAGALGFILADNVGWQQTYFIMACLMGVGALTTLWADVPTNDNDTPATLQQAIIEPFTEFFSRKGALAIVLLIIFYKFGDALAAKLMSTFLLRDIGASLTEIAAVNKAGSMAATIVGAFIAGIFMVRMRLYTALMTFGLLQAVSNLMFVWLASVGYHQVLMASSIIIENLCGGMGMVAFVALLMALCDKRYTAFQYAGFSALASIGREVLGPVAAYIADQYGWVMLFQVSFVISFPGLILLWYLRDRIPEKVSHHTDSSDDEPPEKTVAEEEGANA